MIKKLKKNNKNSRSRFVPVSLDDDNDVLYCGGLIKKIK